MKKKQASILALCAAVALGAASLGGCSVGEAVHEGVTAVADSVSKPARFDTSGTIEQTTMLDNDVLTVIAESLEYRNDVAYLKLSLTNNTEGDIYVSTATLGYSPNYVNDCMVDMGHVSCDIPAGETVEEETYFSLNELQLYGVRKIGVLGLGLRATDEENNVFKDTAEITTSLSGSEGVDSSTCVGFIDNPALVEKLAYEITPASSIVHDLGDAGIEIPAAFLLVNKDGEQVVIAELKNNADEALIVQTSNVAIDGALAYEGPWSQDAIAPGKRLVLDCLRLNRIAEKGEKEIDLSNVEEVGMKVTLKDDNGNTVLDPVDVIFTL